MIIIKEVLKVIDIMSAMCMIFYIITGICVLKANNKIKTSKIKKKIACVVPARNEEKVIGNLLESLNNQNYPKELYDVFVLPNNCVDKTENVAKEQFAKIINCDNIKMKSKGDVLRHAFDYLKDYDYDAYIIFDADNIVHPEFIEKMNNVLCAGYRSAQGYRDSKNPSDSWVSGSYSLHYMIQNYFLNKARMNINWSSFINGTGFMISKDLIEEKGYSSSTMTEDIELSVKCAITNEKIAFAEEAITYDEQPITLSQSWKQRERWSIGTLQCLKIYAKELMKDCFKNKNFASLDSLLFLLAPIIQLTGAATFILHMIVKLAENSGIDIITKLIFGVMWYIVSIFMAILIIKVNKKSVKSYIKGIISLPIFYFTWIPINISALMRKEAKWERIEHTRIVKLDNIIKLNYIKE